MIHKKKRGQMIIELLFAIAIMLIFLSYSVSNSLPGTNKSLDTSVKLQSLTSAKSISITIADAINSVAVQPTTAKATRTVNVGILSNEKLVATSWEYADPQLFINIYGNTTLVAIIDNGGAPVLAGDFKNAAAAKIITVVNQTTQGVPNLSTSIPLSALNDELKIVVVKDPSAQTASINYDQQNGVLTITLKGARG